MKFSITLLFFSTAIVSLTFMTQIAFAFPLAATAAPLSMIHELPSGKTTTTETLLRRNPQQQQPAPPLIDVNTALQQDTAQLNRMMTQSDLFLRFKDNGPEE